MSEYGLGPRDEIPRQALWRLPLNRPLVWVAAAFVGGTYAAARGVLPGLVDAGDRGRYGDAGNYIVAAFLWSNHAGRMDCLFISQLTRSRQGLCYQELTVPPGQNVTENVTIRPLGAVARPAVTTHVVSRTPTRKCFTSFPAHGLGLDKETPTCHNARQTGSRYREILMPGYCGIARWTCMVKG